MKKEYTKPVERAAPKLLKDFEQKVNQLELVVT